jgi:stage V sporulation protein G|tara:strand:- start:185 stop:469 length:285 start_codon:yes stop_codon:yes gene_type:complete
MKAVNLKKYNGEGKTKGFFDGETQEGVVIKGFKLVEGANGLFVGNPSHYSKKDDKWYDDVFIPPEIKTVLEKSALELYGGGHPESNTHDDDLPF